MEKKLCEQLKELKYLRVAYPRIVQDEEKRCKQERREQVKSKSFKPLE